MKRLWFLLALILFLPSCYRLKTSDGGGEVKKVEVRKADSKDVMIPSGLSIEIVAEGFTYPTGITFDENGTAYIIESGYSYGEVWEDPKLLKLDAGGTKTIIAKGGKNGPWNGVDYHEGYFYISEGGVLEGGKILKISKEGKIEVLVKDLPSLGDHHTNGPAVYNGYVYFMQGTATNSGVVGEDNYQFGWLKRFENFHDIPCRDIVINNHLFSTENPLTLDKKDDKITTGAFSAFGTANKESNSIKGTLPCTGAVFRVPLNGGELELVAWGLRNPYGITFTPEGKLFISENSYDDRGSRPVWGTGDVLWEIEEGIWYGWPDYAGGLPIFSLEGFTPPGEKSIVKILHEDPNPVPHPSTIFGVHSSSNGMDVIRDSLFGKVGNILVAQFGDMAPAVGKVWSPVGFKVVSVNSTTGVIKNFAANNSRKNGPATWLKSNGLERPIDVAFNPSGDELYIVDFGILTLDKQGNSKPVPGTGVIWRVKKQK